MGIQVLGPLAVDGSGRLGPRDRAVLLALTVRQGGSVTADELTDAVWADHPPPSAHKNLQSCVVRLRKALGANVIETTSEGYRLGVPAQDLDSEQFETQVTRAHELLALGETDRVVYVLEQALSLWRGSPFTDLAEWPPARREAGRLEEMRRDAEELLLDAQLRLGRAREVLPRAHEMVRSAPLRERRWELLALAQYRTGAQGEALRTIRQLRAVLARELGIDPAPAVVALEQAILQQDPSLQQDDEVPLTSPTCPWQGLQAYDVAEADRFFGREAEIEAGLAILAGQRLLALVGPSGSGKSSLMRAGVGARLRQRGTQCVTITPGRYPTQALTALTRLRAGDALLVDQAEELFTLCEDPDESRAFLDRLGEESEVRPVVVALRADRLADLTAYPAFSRLVERGLYLVGGLDEAGLRLAVAGPARQAGLVLEPGLVDLLVTEVRDDPGALPLLSHALLETWKRREGNTLTVDGYRASGGIHGAVAQSAELLYAQVEPGHREALRELVLRLLSPGSEGEPVRTRVPRRLIGSDPEHERLIEMLVAARLVTSDDGVLEITHESLARAWPRLRGWLEDDVDGRRILHHLSSTADAWDTLGRPRTELYRGVRLTRAMDWWTSTGATLTTVEKEFLEAARAEAEIEERSAAEHARAQARLIRRLRIVLGGAVVLLVLALAAGGVAVVQSNRAERNAARAEQAAVAADARRVGARAQLADDIALSVLLATTGVRLDDSLETRLNLLEVMSRHSRLLRSAPAKGGYLNGVVPSPDGRWLATSDGQGRMHLYDAATSTWVRSYEPDPPPAGVHQQLIGTFSRDSTLLAVVIEGAESREPVRLLDPVTMQPVIQLRFPGHRPLWGINVAFSADGLHLAATVQTYDWPDRTLSGRGYALVWDLRSPTARPVRVPTGLEHPGVALSPDGRILYTSDPLTAYDLTTGERIWRRARLASDYTAFDINRDGTLLALAEPTGRDGLLVDTADGSVVRTLGGHEETISDIHFSPDGSLVGSVDTDTHLVVWSADTGRTVAGWKVIDFYNVAFSPDNRVVYNGWGQSMLRAWDLSKQETLLSQTAQMDDAEEFTQVDVSPDGGHVAVGWRDERDRGWVRFVDTETGETTARHRFPVWNEEQLWTNGLWHPAGHRYAGYWCDNSRLGCQSPGSVIVLDPATGRTVTPPTDVVVEGNGDIWAMGYVDGARGLLVGDSSNKTRIVDAESLEQLGPTFDLFELCPCNAIQVGDGSTTMAWGWNESAVGTRWKVLDASSREVVDEGGELAMQVHIAASAPDGSTVAFAGNTGEIVTVDISSGQESRGSTNVGAPIYWLDYSADGERLVSGAQDGGVSLWDASTLELLGTMYLPDSATPLPASAGFIGDSHDVAVASFDGRVFRWNTDMDQTLELACQMAGRDLTEKEWEQVLPAQPYQSVCPQD